ncbi:MAG: Fe(3+) ABC transporter substrate-binding protein [Marinicellaceae bacterium]
MLKNLFVYFTALLFIGTLLMSCDQKNDAEINVYSARKEALIKPLFIEFEKQTGIKVNLVTGKADALIERLKSEGMNSPADLIITSDAGRLFRAQEFNLTQPVNSQILNDLIPKKLRDSEGHWFGLSLRARPIMYAKDRINPNQLSSYENLSHESWLNRICIRSSSNIYNQSLIASMIASTGEENVETWAKSFVNNFAREPVGGDRDQIKAVAAGQCDIAIANTYYLFGMLNSNDEAEKKAAEKIAIYWPNQDDRGVHVNISGVALTKASKNQDNAIRLMEYLVNEEAQKWYAEENGEYPVRANVAINSLIASWGEFKQDDINLKELGLNNSKAVKLMDRAGWK